mgnify:CR=1 FL=1
MDRNEELWNAIVNGDQATVEKVVSAEVAGGTNALALIDSTMIPALQEIGDRFSIGEVFIPEMLVGAQAMQAGMDILEPLLVADGKEPIARVCIGTVKGDLHDIGKNLVIMMLKGAGFEVEDLGVNCEIDRYSDAVERGAEVVCLSALLSTTRNQMRPVIEHFADRPDIKVVVGGAAITPSFAAEIGADEYGVDAGDAVRAFRSSLGLSV